ncbi:acyltransferase [Fibrella sp. HMF5335]|uniref:Acyltransferase n=1 Tax=Fibrella rubiginis TaxID=2817060 RepID=A0A939GJH0_9BACT|nr:acyltransferase [Fibrella rubiginis]
MTKLSYIDSLRGIAILGVIMVHVNLNDPIILPHVMNQIVQNGSRGVQLFYLASSFTLCLSFKNRKEEIHTKKNFFLRRFFRIAPLYYIGIIYYLYLNGLSYENIFMNTELLIKGLANFLFIHAFNPYWINSLIPGGWSVGVEVIFYSIFPFLFPKIADLRQSIYLFIFSILLNSLINFLFNNYFVFNKTAIINEYMYMYFINQLPIFALGIIMYFVLYERNNVTVKTGKPLLMLSVLILIQLFTRTNLLFPEHILFGLFFVVFSVSLSLYRVFLFDNFIINYIGKISFSMYLIHFVVIGHIQKIKSGLFFNENNIYIYIVNFAVVLLLTIIFSSISYRLIELPFQKLGRNLIKNQSVAKKAQQVNEN